MQTYSAVPRGSSSDVTMVGGRRVALIVSGVVGLCLLGVALSVDFPRAEIGFKGDEATYYMLGHSLAEDGDFTYERRDLIRVWREYTAPEGVFLKRGKINRLEWVSSFPFIHRIKTDEPDETRLYFGKSFIYPLFAAPFVKVFGTNGFLVFHALLLALAVYLGCTWLTARGSPPYVAAGFTLAFFAASVTPVYFVWLTPEVFNLTLVLCAAFLWTYKEIAPGQPRGKAGALVMGPASDYLAAVLVGMLTFSKPTHAVVVMPIVLLAAVRRQWLRAIAIAAVFIATAGGLFAANAAITGELNYQGGYRKTFYSSTGFPFANAFETFDNRAPVHGRSEAQIEKVVNVHALEVLRHNVWYFFVGRYAGLVPYFFPGFVSAVLFLFARRTWQSWQWLVVLTLVAAAAALVLITPFTWAGGGGPIGNRYFLSFYPLLLVLTPPLAGAAVPLMSYAVGVLFTAKIVLNPFWSSFNPGEHTKAGPLRILPIELSMLNDLPFAASADRSKRVLNGGMLGYFPDDNAYTPEGDAFWVRGGRRADVILRAPLAPQPDGTLVGREIAALTIRVQNGIKRNLITITTGAARDKFPLGPGEQRTVRLAMPRGLPYRPYDTPTSYIYQVSLGTTNGFVPFLETPPSSDSRFLGAQVTLIPEFR